MTVAALLAGGFSYAADDATAPKDATPKTDKPATAEAAPRKSKAADDALTPEQRAAKRKEMAAKRAKRLKDLKEKKAAGTLSEKEQEQLTRLEKAGPPPGGHRPVKPKTDDNVTK